jgi:type IV pilus assembly protein PilA
MVVVLIIAILLAIAIPTFLGAKSSANARAAQANDRNALTAEQTVYTNGQIFSTDVAATGVLFTAEPALKWLTGATGPTASNQVGVWTGPTTDVVFLEAYGADKNCYVIQQVNTPGGTGVGTGYAVESGACTPAVTGTTPATAINAAAASTVAKETAGSFPATFYATW